MLCRPRVSPLSVLTVLSPSLVASCHTEELACLQFSLLAAVAILQNRQAANSIPSEVVTMFSVVLTQPMALEECSSLNS